MKRGIFLLIIVIVIISAVAFVIFSNKSDSERPIIEKGNIELEKENNNTSLTVSKDSEFEGFETEEGFYIDKYTGSAKIINIPEEINGKKVIGVKFTTFNEIQIREVTFPSGVTKIESKIFAGKSELEKVVLNDGIKIIETYAFVNCTNLREVNFPSTLEIIDDYAFVGCEKIDRVELNEGLLKIGMTVFVANFETITIPSTVTAMDMYALSISEILKDVYFLGRYTIIDDYAISDCPNVVVHGYKGSTAEQFAAKRNLPFVAIDENIIENNISM